MTSDEIVITCIKALGNSKIPYMVVGSLSTNLYAAPRSTQDADIVVELQPDSLARLMNHLGPSYRLDAQSRFEPFTAIRDIVAEMVREKVLLNLEQEVPHGVATQVEEFKARSQDMTYIAVTVFVERESHKGILIGKNGQMLKMISQQAREEIEPFVGTRVYLELWVKVLKNWRRNENALRRLGYRLPRKI